MDEIPSKFNDVSALVKAYESLEKEYTRKCQELNRLKKAGINEENANAVPVTPGKCRRFV